MKWALIMYFFQLGAYGGWSETDRIYFPDYKSCIEAETKWKSENSEIRIVKVRCVEVD